MDATYHLGPGYKPTFKRFADLDGPDFFPTPAWATYALIDNESFSGDLWESACGDGAMTRVLDETGCIVYSSDLHDRGFGNGGVDFITTPHEADNIVTHPPFHSAEGFVAAGLQKSKRKFALLLRLAFLEGAKRADTIFQRNPPSRVWVFSERIIFHHASAVQKGSGTSAYAWFVWDRDATGSTELKWFKPGYKARYS
jgi:hypothetical protein